MTHRTSILFTSGLLLTVATLPACKSVCVDDGFAWKQDPEACAAASLTDSSSESNTDSESNSNSDSNSNTDGTAGSESDSNTNTTPSGTDSDSGASMTDATAGTDSITDSNTFTDSNTQTDSNTMTDTETGVDTEPCLDENINFSQKIPTVVLLIDQSGSMVEDFAGDTRWDAVHDALFNPAGVVTQLEGSVRFGLALYTSFNGFDFGECPVIQDVPPALNNAAAMEALYAANVPEEDTPTGDSINAIVPDLQAMPSDGPRIIVLATDGEPDTCEEPDPQNGQQFSVDAAAASFQAGIPVFIISVGNDVSDQHLQDMANAGAGVMGNNPDAPFYKANNQQGLVDAFDQIINGVRDCTLQLDAEIPEGMEGECEVSINGSTVPHGGMNGWSSSGAMEIELQGSACEAIQEGDIDVQITCSCNVIF